MDENTDSSFNKMSKWKQILIVLAILFIVIPFFFVLFAILTGAYLTSSMVSSEAANNTPTDRNFIRRFFVKNRERLNQINANANANANLKENFCNCGDSIYKSDPKFLNMDDEDDADDESIIEYNYNNY